MNTEGTISTYISSLLFDSIKLEGGECFSSDRLKKCVFIHRNTYKASIYYASPHKVQGPVDRAVEDWKSLWPGRSGTNLYLLSLAGWCIYELTVAIAAWTGLSQSILSPHLSWGEINPNDLGFYLLYLGFYLSRVDPGRPPMLWWILHPQVDTSRTNWSQGAI